MIGLQFPTDDQIDLRVPPSARDELLSDLDVENVRYAEVFEFSRATGGDWAVYSVALTATSLAADRLVRALVTFLMRHRGKSVKVNLRGETFEATGFSVEEVRTLLRTVLAAKEEDAENWKRLAEQHDPPEESDSD